MKRIMKMCTAFAVIVGMLMPSVPASADTVKDLSDNDIHVLQVLNVFDDVDDEEAEGKFEAAIYDGTKKLVEGEDYELVPYSDLFQEGEESGTEEDSEEFDGTEDDFWDDDDFYNYDTAVAVRGIGNYTGEIQISEDNVLDCEKENSGDWIVYITDKEEQWCSIGGYKGSSAKVNIPEKLNIDGTKYFVDDVLPGSFVDLPNLESVDFMPSEDSSDLEIYPYTFINCPQLSYIRSIVSMSWIELDDVPGPFVLGTLNGELKVDLPFSFYWDYGSTGEYGIATYCSKYGYVLVDDSQSYQKNGWNYRISESAETAIITSYEGEAESVKVPSSVEFGGVVYEIESIQANVFRGRKNLKVIDLGAFDLVEGMCSDCPNLEKITTTGRDFQLEGPLVNGDAPEAGKLVVSTYRVNWVREGNTVGEDQIITIEDYCAEYGYVYEVRKNDRGATNSKVILCTDTDYDVPAIAGYTVYGIISFKMEGEEFWSDDEELQISVKNWSSSNTDIATVNEDGKITFSPNAKTNDTVIISAIMNVEGTDYNVNTEIGLNGRLQPEKSNYRVTVGASGVQLSCWENVYSYDGENVTQQSLPGDVTYKYEIISGEDKIEVSDDGVVTAKEGATAGTATVGVIVAGLLEGAEKEYEYKAIYKITVVESATDSKPDTDVTDKQLVIYGYAGSDAENQVKKFVSSLPADQKALVVYKEYEKSFDRDNDYEHEYWSDYESSVNKVMRGDNKADIILLPGATLRENLEKRDYLVNLEDIGFTAEDYAQAYPYAKSRGTLNGKLKAVTWEVNPGCFIYSKSLARELFGSDDPQTVQQHLKDWDTVFATGEICKEEDVTLLGNPDPLNAFMHSGKTIIGKDDSVGLGGIAKDYFEMQDKIYEAGLVSEDSDDWYDIWDITYSNYFLGYFADARIVLRDLKKIGASNLYGVCQGPVAYEGNYVDYYAVTNNCANNGLAAKFLRSIVNDVDGAESGTYVPNNQKLVKEIAEDDARYNQFDAVAKGIPNGCVGSLAECMVEALMSYDLTYYERLDSRLSADESIDYVIDEVENNLDDVKISADVPVAKEENPGKTEPGKTEPGKNPGSADTNKVEEHLYSDAWTVDVAATCNKPGSKSKHCKDKGCTAKKNVTAIPATGKHTYGAWTVTKKATCGEAGEQVRVCSVCKKQEKKTIPAIGYVKGAAFVNGNHNYKILTVAGKKGTVAWTGMVSAKKSVSIPKTVKVGGITFTVVEVGTAACKNNKTLKSVTISANVKKISNEAFSGCTKLKTIKIKSTKLKKVGKNAIKGISKKAQIKVPKKKLKAYKKLFKKKTGFKKTMKVK